MSDQCALFLDYVQRNPVNREVLERAGQLRLPDWWLAAGALFQTVWNVMDGRHPTAGIRDYDLFYFDPDLSWAAEDAVIAQTRELFAGVDAVIEVRNEARVHLWYEEHFGVPAAPFTSSADAIDHFASTTCCYAVTRRDDRTLDVYAPHGFDDLFGQRVRPNPLIAPRAVYESKAARWVKQWPGLVVDPWPQDSESPPSSPQPAHVR